jgi:hypothetical protein
LPITPPHALPHPANARAPALLHHHSDPSPAAPAHYNNLTREVSSSYRQRYTATAANNDDKRLKPEQCHSVSQRFCFPPLKLSLLWHSLCLRLFFLSLFPCLHQSSHPFACHPT